MGLYLPPALVYGLIFFLSSLRTDQFPRNFPSVPDAVPHIGEYFLLTLLIARVFAVRPGRSSVFLAIPISGMLGFLDEFHQRFVPTRTFSWIDIGCDLLGASAAVLFFFAGLRRNRGDAEGRSAGTGCPPTL